MTVNPPSLRQQLIAELANYFQNHHPGLNAKFEAENVFELYLWPRLEKAMAAGELLVARNTGPRKEVHEAVMIWLDLLVAFLATLKGMEATISKRRLLEMLYGIKQSATKALSEARANNRRGQPADNPMRDIGYALADAEIQCRGNAIANAIRDQVRKQT